MAVKANGKYSKYAEEVKQLWRNGMKVMDIARHLKNSYLLSESINTIKNFVCVVVKNISQQPSEESKATFKGDEKGAEYSFNTTNQIKTLQDLIDACDIDLSVWMIERWVCNKWEMGSKDEVTGRVNVTPLFQVKIWLKPKGVSKSFFEIRDEIVRDIKKHAPIYPVIKYPKVSEGHLLAIDPCDVHLGKLCSAFETGDEYNTKMAVQRVKEGVAGILQKASGFKIDQILYISGNDRLHIDTPKSTTTSGTHQDSDLMWYDAFRIAKQLDIEILEMLLPIAPVYYQYDPSNHDYMTGFFLAETIAAWFAKNKNIQFNTSIAHRKYYRYHKNLIGTTHGDGAKEQDLALLMANEAPEMWASSKHRYFYTHHLHHKKSKDYMSVCVETLRSPSGTDGWHHRNGYQHAPKAIEGFVHHKEHGQIARLTNIF
jgi:hypothetical protein